MSKIKQADPWKDIYTKDQYVINDIKNPKVVIGSNKMSFGTAGIRGILGAGLDKINEFTIAAAAEAYAIYIKKSCKSKKPKIIIANDNRRNGFFYRELIVRIFNKHGIEPFILKDKKIMATPLLSFLIRDLKAVGGVNLTASHNPKEYNGFKVYNSIGAQMMPNETNEISKIMEDLDPFNIGKSDYKPSYIDDKHIDKYIEKVAKASNHKNLTLSYSPLCGTGNLVAERIFKRMGVNYHLVESEYKTDPEFTDVKSPNPENPKSYHNVLKNGRKHKSDICVITDPDADRVGLVVKYKKRWKYITGNELAALYTNYLLEKLSKQNKIPKNAYIIKSYVSSDLVTKIANSYGVKIVNVPVGFKNIADHIENSKDNFLFGFEESFGMLINKDIARDKDAFQGVVAAIEMASHYKEQGKTLFDVIKEIHNKYRVYRNIQISKTMDENATDKMFSRILKSKYAGEYKVDKIIDYRNDKKNPHKSIQVFLKDGSWIVVRPSGTEPKVKIYIQSIGEVGQDLIHSVTKEKKILDYIDGVANYFPDKKFSWSTVIKYSIFTLIMGALLYFVFDVIYGNYKNQSGSVFSLSRDFKHTLHLWIFFVGILGMFFNILIDAIMKYRLLKFHGQNVKIRHLFISSIMGAIISYLTPLAIGGDGIGYWYLRRKGFQRAPLASTFLTCTVLWQMKNIVLTAIFLPMGLHMFKDILANGDASSKTVMVIFVVGLAWDIISIFMLWILLMSRLFQEWCIRTAIKLLEWLPFIILSDPGAKASGFMYEFANLRAGMKKIWKSPKMLGEAMFYETLPKLLSVAALLNIAAGIIKPDLEYGSYWSQIIATDVINTANSMSLTPGATGFIEFISIHIRENIYVRPNANIHSSSTDTAIYMDVIYKFIYEWPYLVLSTLVAVSIILGESRNKKHIIRNKINGTTKVKTSLYKKTAIIWPVFIGAWAAVIMLF